MKLLWSQLWHKKRRFSAQSSAVSFSTEKGEGAALLKAKQDAFLHFYNLHTTLLFDEEQAKNESESTFYEVALALSCAMEPSSSPEHEVMLRASHYTEQARQKAMRCIKELHEVSESVLIDERNHLLAGQINQRAEVMGLNKAEALPFSGVDTATGSPAHAFQCKLLADSSLNRGMATGLLHDTIVGLVRTIQLKAQADIAIFMQMQHEEAARV